MLKGAFWKYLQIGQGQRWVTAQIKPRAIRVSAAEFPSCPYTGQRPILDSILGLGEQAHGDGKEMSLGSQGIVRIQVSVSLSSPETPYGLP